MAITLPEQVYDFLEIVRTRPWTILAVLFVLRLCYKRYGSSLRSVPGPFAASFTRLWKLRQMYRGDMHLTNVALHRKYGTDLKTLSLTKFVSLFFDSIPLSLLRFDHIDVIGPVVRIAPNEVSLDDPEAVKQIYGHATEFKKAPWYYASGGIHPEVSIDLFTDTDEKRHAKNRCPR